jgi:hypothetical protein
VEIPVTGRDLRNLSGLELSLAFDPQVAQAQGVKNARLGAGFLSASSVDNESGVVRVAMVSLRSTSGTGPLVSVQFLLTTPTACALTSIGTA